MSAAPAIHVVQAFPPGTTAVLVLTAFGSLLAVGTLAGLLAHEEGLIDHDSR